MQQAVRDLNFPLGDVRVGNTAPADREVADARTAASSHVCQDTSAVVGKVPPVSPDSVRPGGAPRHLGKTCPLPVRGGEVTADPALAVGKHPQPISPCREWFVLFRLCQPGRAGEAEGRICCSKRVCLGLPAITVRVRLSSEEIEADQGYDLVPCEEATE